MSQIHVDPATGRRYEIGFDGVSRWVDAAPPAVSLHYRPEPARKSHKVRNTILGVLGVLLAVGVVGSLFDGGDTTATTAAGKSSASAKASAKAPAKAAAKPAPAPAVERPVKFKAVTSRTWKLIAKNPDKYKGQAIIVYGHVTQFDSATGTDVFRASVDGVKHAESYEYDTNTILGGDGNVLDGVVQDDLFQANVIVKGAESYETMMGGETTVPLLRVESIKVIGSSS